MLVIPAIDLKDGQAVRLFKGDYSQKTVYSDHPEELAQTFEKAGATYLHVVDLDGAKDGLAKNLETIKAIRKSTQMKIELGGGIRDLKTVQLYLDEVGIDRVRASSFLQQLGFVKVDGSNVNSFPRNSFKILEPEKFRETKQSIFHPVS